MTSCRSATLLTSLADDDEGGPVHGMHLVELPHVLSMDDVTRLLEAAPGPGPQDKAALSIAYGGGLRPFEPPQSAVIVMARILGWRAPSVLPHHAELARQATDGLDWQEWLIPLTYSRCFQGDNLACHEPPGCWRGGEHLCCSPDRVEPVSLRLSPTAPPAGEATAAPRGRGRDRWRGRASRGRSSRQRGRTSPTPRTGCP